MSAHCDDCGFDLPYEGDCLYCAARKRVAELEAALHEISHVQFATNEDMQQFARDALAPKGDEAK